jgi:hypothetical protein
MKSEYALSQDGYGTYARASHLADALEHICLCKGKSPTQAEVLDWIEDATWTLASDEAIETPSASIANDDPAARVFGLLAERQSVLGSHYPFEARDNRIYRIASKPDALRQPYSVLLAIAIAHSYALCPEPDPTRVFEAYVAAALGDHGLAVVDTGNTRRGMSDFESLIERVGRELRIPVSPEAATYRSRAQEEGVDTVAMLPWGDHRIGRWLFLGQAACGKSDTWLDKAGGPADGLWLRALNDVTPALTFLAVPYHVEPRHFRYLVEARATRTSVLDRLRLARYRKRVSADDAKVTAAVFEATMPEWR